MTIHYHKTFKRMLITLNEKPLPRTHQFTFSLEKGSQDWCSFSLLMARAGGTTQQLKGFLFYPASHWAAYKCLQLQLQGSQPLSCLPRAPGTHE